MSWTAPRTWVTGEVVTAAQMNQQVRDNELELRRLIGCKAKFASAPTVGSGATNSVLAWDGTDEFDTDAFHDPVTNNSRITIPTGYSGYFEFIVNLNRTSGTGTLKNVRIRKNGGSDVAFWASAGANALIWVLGVVVLAASAADYFEVRVDEGSGASLTLDTNSSFSATFRGA